MTYEVVLAPPARRALAGGLPPSVAAAVVEFLSGPLAREPFRVGKPLRNELEGKWSARRGEYRVIYTINARVVTVTVLTIAHRRDAYRP
ncbi:type II toxin-antitoxin system RelE/ParE family toxin [Cellulomonas sp. Sa3CUA2]|uniref:Type II toxin-antitoxin system RelE/ParE family toxin n=1 Tax=Cellulomonas avistercoris TaxID=2762242 RepID=A0ABR8QDX8_9CELL|nr:type II toxin-antitoxin system RelE/ParE family toxin [Cellulomonas avistercoris]MBD7918637.1 type II toxin-antitoxin system RelE/ParE family toxin [Cellulomonas avistercoris]